MNDAELLDDLEKWFTRFISMPDPADYKLLALWTVHTHLAAELYTTPRLLIDSTIPGSGKTTVLEHLAHLCWSPVQAASISSPALLVRLLQNGVRTLLVDEVNRSLSPNKPGVDDLIAILNSGYKRGATRPVLTPAKGGNWEVQEMPTFCPVAMAGNSPNLPDDTKSRSIRILLMPDLNGTVEDSDWEHIEAAAGKLHARIVEFADRHRPTISADVNLPAECVGRAKEKWRPLMRVAVAAGGNWQDSANKLIDRGLAEDAHERDAGLRSLPPGMVLLTDLYDVWPDTEELVPTKELVSKLIAHNPDYWGEHSSYGKALTDTRFGRIVTQASKVESQRPGGRGPRGYTKAQFNQVWHQLGIPPSEPGALGEPGAPGAKPGNDVHRVNQVNQVHQVETDPPEPGAKPGATPAAMPPRINGNSHDKTRERQRQRTRNGQPCPACAICGHPVVAGQGDTHYSCQQTSKKDEVSA